MNTPLTLASVLTEPVTPPQMLPSLFISHGAPTIAIEDTPFTQALQQLGKTLPKPRLIIIMSAHWESNGLLINANPAPTTWHDFGAFPKALFDIQYPAIGNREAADSLADQLRQQGVPINITTTQPFDHGVWTPLLHMYPQADVPIVQVSLPVSFDTQDCYALGQLFAPLRDEQVLIIGSGSITHNLRHVRFNSMEIEPATSEFKYWMIEQLRQEKKQITSPQSPLTQGWLNWQQHPLARVTHPTPEHLLPLFFARGAGGDMWVVHESFAHYSLGMDIYRFD